MLATIPIIATLSVQLPDGVVWNGVQHGPGMALLLCTDMDPARPSCGATFCVDLAQCLERAIGAAHDAKRIAFGECLPISEIAPHCSQP